MLWGQIFTRDITRERLILLSLSKKQTKEIRFETTFFSDTLFLFILGS